MENMAECLLNNLKKTCMLKKAAKLRSSNTTTVAITATMRKQLALMANHKFGQLTILHGLGPNSQPSAASPSALVDSAARARQGDVFEASIAIEALHQV